MKVFSALLLGAFVTCVFSQALPAFRPVSNFFVDLNIKKFVKMSGFVKSLEKKSNFKRLKQKKL